MAALLFRLRLQLLLGALRGDPRARTGVLVRLALLIMAVCAACWALLALRAASGDVAVTTVTLAGAALTAGALFAPLAGGAQDPLDPRRFAVFGLEPQPLTHALALAGLASPATPALLAVLSCATVLWAEHGVPIALGIAAALVAVVTCLLAQRLGVLVSAVFLRERRSRELSTLLTAALLVVVIPAGVFLSSLDWNTGVPSQLHEAARVLALTPFGAAFAIPAAVADGDPVPVVGVIVAVATPVVLWTGWAALCRRLLTTPPRPAVERSHAGLGWFALAPATPTGVIAARSLVYWLRDGRYLVNAAVIPVAALLATVPLLVAGVPVGIVALVPVPIAALLFGWLPHDDLAYDSTAVWLHLASGTRGIADRVGRILPVLLIAIPVLAIGAVVSIALNGRWAVLPALAGVAAALLAAGLGLSSVASVLAPYPVPHPGDSPFQQPQRSGGSAFGVQAAVLALTVVSAAPATWLAWLAVAGDASFALPALWAGLGGGLLVLVGGLAAGAAVFDRRGTRLMEFAEGA